MQGSGNGNLILTHILLPSNHFWLIENNFRKEATYMFY